MEATIIFNIIIIAVSGIIFNTYICGKQMQTNFARQNNLTFDCADKYSLSISTQNCDHFIFGSTISVFSLSSMLLLSFRKQRWKTLDFPSFSLRALVH